MSDLTDFFGPHPLAALAVAILKANVAAGVAIAAVAACRGPVRRRFGATIAYDLWALPPLVGLMMLVGQFLPGDREARMVSLDYDIPHFGLALAGWACVAGTICAAFALAQARFARASRAGAVGPAAVGFISPRVLLPADDGEYTPAERELIRAHERQHVARKDPRAAALVALAQAVFWFNPLVHLAARLIRLDQELACDEAVLRRRPAARALYARTLLKAQLASQPLPFGCQLTGGGRHPLEVRIEHLKACATGPARERGPSIVAPPIEAILP